MIYRDHYGVFACSGITYNHESPRRRPEFVTQKIALAAARHEKCVLGSLDAVRDWGFVGDYVVAMHMMLQQSGPKDYVIATGDAHTVGEFAEAAYAHAGLDWREFVSVDPQLVRKRDIAVGR